MMLRYAYLQEIVKYQIPNCVTSSLSERLLKEYERENSDFHSL